MTIEKDIIMKGFNSKLVRLKDAATNRVVVYKSEFQFQTGAIKSALTITPERCIGSVSIPNWCD